MVKVCPIVSRYLSLPRLIPLVAKESYCAEQDRERAREGHPQGERLRCRKHPTRVCGRGLVVSLMRHLLCLKDSGHRSPTSGIARSRAWTLNSCGTSVLRSVGPRSRVAGRAMMMMMMMMMRGSRKRKSLKRMHFVSDRVRQLRVQREGMLSSRMKTRVRIYNGLSLVANSLGRAAQPAYAQPAPVECILLNLHWRLLAM